MKQPPANFRLQQRRFQRGLLAGMVFFQLLLAGRASALDPDRELSQYNCQTWSRQTGLPANGVNAIAQTKDGYLWFGTAAGLLRFDGIEFKQLDLHAVAAVRNSFVTSLTGDHSGGLWVGLQNSAFGFYDGRSFSFHGGTNTANAWLDVRTILEGADGTLWVVAGGEAAQLNRSGALEPIPMTGSDTNLALNIKCGYEDPRGRLWLGTANQGVYCWQDGKMTKLPDPKLDDTSVLSIAEDWDGQIWVGTSIGLFCYDASLQRRGNPPVWDEVRALLVDRQGVLWIGTSGHGLARYQHGTYDFLQKADGLGNDYVNAIAEDSEGSLWVGTRNGISQISDVKFPIQHAAEDPTVRDALAVAASPRGGVWIASGGGGVARFDPKAKIYTTLSGLPDPYAKRVFEASNGDVYVVSGTGKLVVFSGGKAVVTNSTPSMIVGLAEDEQGVVVSVGGDLYRAGTNYFRPYAFTNADKPPFYWILNLASGKNGVIWVASGNGIFRVKDGAYQHWAAAEGLADPVVATVCEDQDGVVWAGLMSGIARLKDNHIRLINRQDGLFDDNIYAIVPDDLGNLWVDSGRGVFRVTRQNLNDFADGKTNHVACTVFDGINSVKVADKTVQERVGCKTTDGRIWFPGPLGVVMIDPANIPVNRVAPPVHIERVRANGKELGRTGQIVVPPGAGDLEFDCDALTFIAPQTVQFRYRLEGYDPTWVDAGDRQMAFYTNLKPGNYTFRVIAANADGVWNPTGDTLHAELRPHYYQTAWFRLLCVALAVAALGGIYLRRIRRLSLERQALQKSRDLLEVKIQERTAELANANAALQEENAERQQAQEALRRSQEEFKDLFENAPVGFHEVDAEGRLVRINNTELKMLGYSAGELLGQFVWKISAEEETTRRIVLAKLRGEVPPSEGFERGFRRKDGSLLQVWINDRILKRGDGLITGLHGSVQDITGRKRAEEKVAQEQARFKLIFDSMPIGIAYRVEPPEGPPTRIINDAHLEICGLTREQDQVPGIYWQITHPEDFARQQQLMAGLGPDRTGRYALEKRYLRPDGQVVWVAFTFQGRKRPDGSHEELTTVVDITERKRVETALNFERDLWQTLLDTSPDHIYFKDVQSRFIKSSLAQARQFGVASPEEMTGKTDFDFFTEAHARPAFEDEQEIIRTGRPMIAKEESEVWKDGHVTWASSTKMPLRDATGKIIGIMGISRDITERKRMEETLAMEQRLLSSLITATPDTIYFKDTESRFMRINEAFVRKHGLSDPSAALGKTDFDLFGEQHARQTHADEQRIMATGEPIIDQEEQEDWKDGRVTWVSSTKMPLRDGDGKIIGIMGISRDITERKRLEAQLFQSQKLETVGKLAGGIAHEFNSILTAIIGQSELLREDLPAGNPLAQNATEITKAAERAATLTRQLLAYGRKQFLRPEVLNLNRVITSMSDVVSHLMGGEVADVSIIPAAGLRLVKADAGQIEQVIMNLAMNARDAMPHGGKLTLETANVTFDRDSVGRYPELKPGGYAMLAITDTGRGMSEKVKAHVFEPFFTTKDIGQGTGLGLSTCYGIIKQSGGHISVYSEPGRGTTFKIYLPQVETPTEVPIKRLDAPDLPRGTETILLVEDDPALREMAAALLRRLGYTVLAAANGLEALSLKQEASTGHVDLLFTDVVMPHMSGKELADRVRALYPHTRILFTSAYTENAIVHQGVLDPGVALLPKPFTPSALALKVREALDAPGAPPPAAGCL